MKTLRIGVVAGEPSGDLLGADLIHALRQVYPHFTIEGIGGAQMIAAGCQSFFAMECLSVMGVFEVLRRLPQILTIRHSLIQYFLQNPPDIFIGIDAPDFNLRVEEKLKAAGIPTLHYVSPTVWAWKQWRLKKIARAVNKILVLLPFEAKFYEDYKIPVKFVGHPLADSIPLQSNKQHARRELNISLDKTVIAILPGSRANEIKYLGKLFLETAQWCHQKNPDLLFVAPMVNQTICEQFSALVKTVAPELPLQLVMGRAEQVMAAADVVLLASGTATLQTMLVKRPMVVAYQMSKLSFAIAKRMVKTSYISLPNLLANKALVPELIQDQATVENLGAALLNYLSASDQNAALIKEFTLIHEKMRQNASQQAAQAVLELVKN